MVQPWYALSENSVNDFTAILGIGRSSSYKLTNSGLFKTLRIGNMIRIFRKSFED